MLQAMYRSDARAQNLLFSFHNKQTKSEAHLLKPSLGFKLKRQRELICDARPTYFYETIIALMH